MSDTTTTRAAAYVRVSTERQATEGLSLDQQKRNVEAYIAAREDEGWQLAADTFVEAGVSGRRDDRPKLAEVMALAQSGGIDVLVVPKLDRLGRSTIHLLSVCRDLKAAGVRLVSLGEGIDTSTAAGQMLLEILAAVASFESARIGERVASVSASRAEQGRHHGRPPYGYNADDGLQIVTGEAAIIRRIFSEYVAGRSQRTIARALNDDGIPGQRGEWTQGTISKLLSNPVFAGRIRHNGEEYDGQHAAIIDADTWRKAEQLRAAATRSDGGRGRTPTANHLLAGGLLRCGACGSAMNSITKPTKTAGRLYEVYICSNRRENGAAKLRPGRGVFDADAWTGCNQPPVRRETIDNAIWEFFTTTVLDLDATREALTEDHDRRLGEVAALHGQALADAQTARERLARVRRDYADGKLDADDWASFRDELTAEQQAADAKVEQLAQQRQAVEQEAASIDTESEVLAQLSALRATIVGEARDDGRNTDALRAALRRMFDHFRLAAGSEVYAPGEAAVDAPSLSLPAEQHDERLWLRPVIRPEAIEGFDPRTKFAALRRAAITLSRSDSGSLIT